MPVVKLISQYKGVPLYRLNATELNDDWLRSNRLLKDNRLKEVVRLDNKPMFTEPYDGEDVVEVMLKQAIAYKNQALIARIRLRRMERRMERDARRHQ
jgi:hypothetical protein